MPPLRSGGVSRMRVAQVVVGRGSWISGRSANSGGRKRSIRADHVTWVRIGGLDPAGDPALQPEQRPMTTEASTKAGLRVAAVASPYTAVEVSTGPLDADGGVERAAEEHLLGDAVGQRVVATSGVEP